MTTHNPPSDPKPPLPDEGADSVIELHRQHMAELNDASLTVDGTPPEEDHDAVRGMLNALAREHAEPRDGFEPVPFWVALIFGALLAWGGFYLGTNSAEFRADVYDRSDLRLPEGGSAAANVPDPDPQTVVDLMKVGEQKFGAVCAACHMLSGAGNPGQNIPPLLGSEWVVGEEASAARQVRIVLYGLSGEIHVKGRRYNGVMPNQGNVMKDYEIAGVLTFVRNSWGNKADPDNAKPAITAAAVRAARAKEGTRKTNGTQPVSEAELKKLPIEYSDLAPPAAPEKK